MLEKANLNDMDELFKSMNASKNDQERRLLHLEREVDTTVSELRSEMESTKYQCMSNINKKADFSVIEKIRESTLKMADMDYFHSQINKLKQEMLNQIELTVNESNFISRRSTEFDKFEERSTKAEANCSRALDEIH